MEGSIDDCRPSREIVMFAPLTLGTDGDNGFSLLMTEVIFVEAGCCGESVDSSTVVVASPFLKKYVIRMNMKIMKECIHQLFT